MNKTIQEHLRAIYPPEIADSILPEIQALISKHQKSAPSLASQVHPSNDGISLDQTRSLLITYGDQVQNPDSTPLQCLARFCKKHLQGLLGGIHILPFFPYSSDDGFSVIDYRAVDPALGSWEDIQKLKPDFDLMYDAVFNHISAQSEWFQGFLQNDPAYEHFFVTVEGDPDLSQVVRPRTLPLLTPFLTQTGEKKVWTTFSPDQIDLNARHPAVLLQLLDILLFYVNQGAKFIRLDAIAFLWKEIGTSCIHLPETHRIIQLMRRVLDEATPQTFLITETNVAHEHNISYFGDGTNEAQLVYNFALPPLVLHALLTGNSNHLTQWAQSLKLPSSQVTFFNFLASHDGIGVNPARGILSEEEIQNVLVQITLKNGGFVSQKTNPDGTQSPYELNINYFDALSDPVDTSEPDSIKINRFLAAQAIMLSLAGMPGIYFHSLFGSRNDRAGAESSGIPRRINREKLQLDSLEQELADSNSLRSKVFAGFKSLLQIRNTQDAFHPSGPQKALNLDPKVFSLLRESPRDGEQILALHHLSDKPVSISLPLDQLQNSCNDSPTDLLKADTPIKKTSSELEIQLAPYQVAWIRLS